MNSQESIQNSCPSKIHKNQYKIVARQKWFLSQNDNWSTIYLSRHHRKITWIDFFFCFFLCCLSSHMSWFAWMKLILGPLVLEAYKFKLKWVISRVGLSEVCRSPDAKSCHSHLPLCPRMASCRGSNLSETLRCPDIAHNRLNLRLPITAQILSSSKVHRGHPGILLLTASSSTICICQSLKILEKLNY